MGRWIIGWAAMLIAAAAQGQQFTMKLSSPTVNDVTRNDRAQHPGCGLPDRAGAAISGIRCPGAV